MDVGSGRWKPSLATPIKTERVGFKKIQGVIAGRGTLRDQAKCSSRVASAGSWVTASWSRDSPQELVDNVPSDRIFRRSRNSV